MTKILPIVVADASRARFFTYDPGDALVDRAPSFVEQADLVDPERRLRPSQIYGDTRPGSDRTATGRGYAVDDHRGAHEIEVDRRFATEIAHRLEELITSTGARRAVMVASPRLLGLMRPSLSPLAGRGVELEEIDRDLTRETPAQLQDHLAALGYLPPRSRATR